MAARWVKFYGVIIMTVLASSSSPSAQENIYGVGAIHCREISVGRGNQLQDGMILAWVGGYLSGVSMSAAAQGSPALDLSGISHDDLISFVYAGCSRSDPSSLIISVVEGLVPRLPRLP